MNLQKMSYISLFIGLSIIGAYIKIPSPIGSIALDIFPALVAVIVIGRKSGLIIAVLGHLISALLGGMPLGPFHFMIAIEMGIIVWLFGHLYPLNRVVASIMFVLLNGVIASVPFIFIMSFEFFLAITPSLLVASAINVVIALIVLPRLEPIFRSKVVKQEC